MELPQPIRFWTSAGTELLQLSICFSLASFFLPVHLSYFCLGETSLLLLSVFLLLSSFSSLQLLGDTRLTLTGEETWESESHAPRQPHLSASMLPPKGQSYSSPGYWHASASPFVVLVFVWSEISWLHNLESGGKLTQWKTVNSFLPVQWVKLADWSRTLL